MKRRVLVIDEDKRNLKLITQCLEQNGFSVVQALGFASGFAQLSSSAPDIVIINMSNEPEQGIKTLKSIRMWSTLPIIALGAEGEKHSTAALYGGADIYLSKPFSTAELLAYIKVCEKRLTEFEAAIGIETKESFEAKGLSLNFASCEVFVEGKKIHLTKNEFRILSLLCKYSGKVLTYDFIMKSVWGPLADTGNGILRVNITNIRKKIEPDMQNFKYIFTENGIGYRLIPSDK